MNFIILTDYYHPIIKSGSIIVGDLADQFIKQGHKVTIITFVNNQNIDCQVTVENNVKIIRIRSITRQFGMVGRLWAEYRYSNKIISNLKKLQNIQCDGIICYSPSIFYGPAIRWLKNKYNSKAYLIVRDIFPKWALDAGLLKKGALYNYFKFVERKLYSTIDILGIEAKADFEYFEKYGLEKSIKIEVLNNWGTVAHQADISSTKNITNNNKINIIYGGNMGDAQDLLSLISLIDQTILDERALLVLIGSGNQFKSIKDTIHRKNLNNIVLMPSVDRDKYLSILSNADIGLVSLGNKMLSNNYPLKMIGYMQLSKPILASVNKNNEIIQMIIDNNVGLVSVAGNKDEFNKNLDILISNKALRKEQGDNGLKLFNNKFTVQVASSQIYNHFL
jgi:O26-antigen biosynthesis N-acetyl-L-fucosamine transferase